MTSTHTPRELLERIGKSRYYDVSDVVIERKGDYIIDISRQLYYVGEEAETVVERDHKFQDREFTSLDGHPGGYDGRNLPELREWAHEHGKFKFEDEAIFHDFTVIDSRNEQYERCYKCDGNGHVTCPKCGGTNKRPCTRCGGSGEKTITDPCEACAGHGVVQREREVKCEKCGGRTKVKRNGRYIECNNCAGTGSNRIRRDVNCKACNGTGSISVGTEPCGKCDAQNEHECSNCDEHNHVVCSQCRGDEELWTYERVTDRYQVKLDLSTEQPLSDTARELIMADEIEWDRTTEATETDSSVGPGQVVREETVTLRAPMITVGYSPTKERSIYTGESYEPWEGEAQIEQIGDNVKTVTANFGPISQHGFGTFLKSVVYTLPLGVVLAVILGLALSQLDSTYGLARNAIGGVVSVAIIATSITSTTGYALGLTLIALFAVAPALGVASTDQAVSGILFATIPILVGSAPLVYRYMKYN